MYIINIFLTIITYSIINLKSMHMLQQNRYNRGNKYNYWIIQNFKKVFLNISFCLIIVTITNNSITKYMYPILLASLIILNTQKKKEKLPLNVTNRIKRLMLTNLIFISLIILLVPNNYTYLVSSILIYLNYIVIAIINYINIPIEKYLGNKNKEKTIKRYKTFDNLITVGITGSYGKTSSKNILNDILSVKYNTLPSPKNYNTPQGLMITINDYLNKFTDVFIAEMGACKVGEIKELCDIVTPKYGILTKVGLAHLETFKTEENIQKTKFELIESLPKDGLGILNGDDEKQLTYKLKNKVPVKFIGINNHDVDVYAKNIKLTKDGSTFDVVFKNKKTYKFQTKLLGKANIYNILAGITLGEHLGIEIEQLQKSVSRVKSVEHRLELKKYYNINLIDDAYNSNPDGFKMAVEVLKEMPGDRIIMTPGIIELGQKDHEVHYELGKIISKSVDKVILVGEKKTKSIYEGLIDNKFKKENIYIINDVMEGFELIKELKQKKDMFVLIENDLPDSFTEKGK